MASSSASDRANVLEEFTAMTGTTEDFAISFLEASDWNLEQAMELFLGGQGGVAQAPRASSSSSRQSDDDEQEASIRRIMQQYEVDRETAIAIRDAGGGAEGAGGAVDAEGVRAPILQKRARLFDFDDGPDEVVDEYLAQDMSGLQVAPGMSLEAQIHLARQFMEGVGAARPGGAAAARPSAPQRASMFAPPRWMMYLGSLEDARNEAKERKRWLLVNIQDEQEFQSLVLNRDLWSDETTQSLINGSFLFWQQERSSTEAQRFLTLYNPTPDIPHVCIIDPRTGERLKILKLKKRETDLRESFFEQVTEFLDVNTFEAKVKSTSGSSSSAAAKPSKPSPQPASAVDLTEDDELEQAIRQSLVKEESKPTPVVKTPTPAAAAPAAPVPPVVPAIQFVPLAPEPPAGANTTTVQFKFPDGSRSKRRFLKTDPVSMLFSYVADSKKVESRFDLMTSDIPARSLLSHLDKSLVDADACNQNLMIRSL